MSSLTWFWFRASVYIQHDNTCAMPLLRIRAMYEPKNSKKWASPGLLSNNFVNIQSFHRWRKYSNIGNVSSGEGAEIESLKFCDFFTFSILAQTLEVTFQVWPNFSHLWTLCFKKKAFRFLIANVLTKLLSKTSRRCSF